MHTPRHRFRREEAMAKSHQRGTVRLEHHSWVGYMNVKLLDPNTGESKWKKQRVGVLGTKSKMTKHQAQDSLAGARLGRAQRSYPANTRYDGDVPTERVVCAAVERLRH
jgi:hypothetical protein